MRRQGHVGAALLAFAPVGGALAAAGAVELALLGAAGTVALATLPDYDLKLPFLAHRGITHTVAFALLVGSVVGIVALVVGLAAGPPVAAVLGGLGLLVGSLAVLSHVAADALTPDGVAPLWPVSARRWSFGLVRSDDPLANVALLVVGVVATGATFHVGGGLG